MKTIKRTDSKRLPVFRRLDFPDAGYTRETHARFEAGETVTVDERVAQFLISRGMAEEVSE